MCLQDYSATAIAKIQSLDGPLVGRDQPHRLQ
jgi:hypothetical protein